MFDIPICSQYDFGVFLQLAYRGIAQTTKQRANSACCVVMIDVHAAALMNSGRLHFALTNGTLVPLHLPHEVERLHREPVGVSDVSAFIEVVHPLRVFLFPLMAAFVQTLLAF